MKKLYLIIPGVSIAALFLGIFISTIFSLAIFFGLPLVTFFRLKRHDAHIFLKSSTPRERLCFLAMSNKGFVPFVAKKINSNWLKIKNYWIRIQKNSEYIFRDKVVLLAQQRKSMSVENILKLKNRVSSSFFSKDLLFSNTFLKSIIWPIAGTVFLFLNLPIPNILVLVIMAAGGPYMLYEIYKTGALEFAGGQSGNEITIFYIRSSRKLKVAQAEAVGQKWWSYKDGMGQVKTLDGTDYFFGKKRVYISGAGCPTTFSLEHAETANWLRDCGLRGWDEFKKAMEMIETGEDYEDCESFEEAYKDKGQDFINDVKKELGKGGEHSGRR